MMFGLWFERNRTSGRGRRAFFHHGQLEIHTKNYVGGPARLRALACTLQFTIVMRRGGNTYQSAKERNESCSVSIYTSPTLAGCSRHEFRKALSYSPTCCIAAVFKSNSTASFCGLYLPLAVVQILRPVRLQNQCLG